MQGFADFSDSLVGGALLVSLSLAIGSVTWAVVVLQAWRRRPADPVLGRCIGLLIAGAGALAVCQVVALVLKAAVLAEYAGAGTLASFAATAQCRAGCVRAGLALGLAAAAAHLRRRPGDGGRWLVLITLTLLLATSGAWLVHAAGRLEGRASLMALTVVHQVGAAMWVGGLIQLVGLWRLARRDPMAAAEWPRLVSRFWRVAVAALVVLLVPGIALAKSYVGSWDALVGTGYGSLIVTKVGLLSVAALLGACNFTAARRARRGGPSAVVRTTVPHLIETEALVLVAILFVAASLSSQPPPVDTAKERASWAEVVEVFRPKWPSLRTPSLSEKRRAETDPFAAVGWERTIDEYRWSNFSHNVAGLFLLGMSVMALAGRRERSAWARRWPLGFVALGIFVFLRASASDETWPFGATAPWSGDAEGFQHRLAALLVLALGLLEWRARARSRGRLPYVLPVLGAVGGVLLLTHAHSAFEPKSSFLVQVTHTAMGMLAVLLACTRWLELRLAPPVGRVAGTASSLAMLLIALVLVFYREANVVLPPG